MQEHRNEARPILYSFRRCPYAIRARLAIAYAGVSVELREIMLKNKPPSMLEYSPKGTVPVLVLPSGQVIDQSLEIMHWALAQNKGDWYSGAAECLKTIDQLIAQNDTQFKPWLDKYKYADRYPEYSQAFYREQCEVFIAQLNTRLEQHTFLMADQCTLADAALVPFVRQFALVDRAAFDGCRFYFVQRWLADFLASPLFKEVMPKFAPWQPGDKALLFPCN